MTLSFADRQATLIIPAEDDPPVDVVRCWVLGALVDVPLVPRLRTALVVEELIANARQHAEPPYVLRLVLDGEHRALRVFVDDCVPEFPAPGADGGAGLVLVDALSRDWGVEQRARAKTVWADVALGVRASGLVMPPQPRPGV